MSACSFFKVKIVSSGIFEDCVIQFLDVARIVFSLKIIYFLLDLSQLFSVAELFFIRGRYIFSSKLTNFLPDLNYFIFEIGLFSLLNQFTFSL